jgi:hypothetical protein
MATYYHVHVVHVRDASGDIKSRPAQLDNHVGPYGDDPSQFGDLYMHVWHAPTPCEDAVLSKADVSTQLLRDWSDALIDGYPADTEGRSDPATNKDSAFAFDMRYCVKWTDVSAHPWEGSLSQLDYSYDPWDAFLLLESWIKAALLAGTAPEKRPGKTQPAGQPSWDDPWWDAQ